MTKFIHVTGTDTEVGKTWITGRLCAAIRKRNINCGVWKPVQSGFPAGSEESDSARLKQSSGVNDAVEDICAFSFEAALTPYLAAKLEGKELTLDKIIESAKSLTEKYDCLLIEGAGGLFAPITESECTIDLFNLLGYNSKTLIISRPGLGTINHTSLTVEALRNKYLSILGVILNGYEDKPERINPYQLSSSDKLKNSQSTNPDFIEKVALVDVIGQVPKETDSNSVDIEDYVDIDYIIEKMKLQDD